jgi:plasmid stabilization system protein ParE
MTVQFLLPAQQEVDDAVAWYTDQSPRLGMGFLDELDSVIHRITALPYSNPEFSEDLRRCLMRRFPYGIIYGVENQSITVVAVAHLHRKPYYYIDRWVSQTPN